MLALTRPSSLSRSGSLRRYWAVDNVASEFSTSLSTTSSLWLIFSTSLRGWQIHFLKSRFPGDVTQLSRYLYKVPETRRRKYNCQSCPLNEYRAMNWPKKYCTCLMNSHRNYCWRFQDWQVSVRPFWGDLYRLHMVEHHHYVRPHLTIKFRTKHSSKQYHKYCTQKISHGSETYHQSL